MDRTAHFLSFFSLLFLTIRSDLLLWWCTFCSELIFNNRSVILCLQQWQKDSVSFKAGLFLSAHAYAVDHRGYLIQMFPKTACSPFTIITWAWNTIRYKQNSFAPMENLSMALPLRNLRFLVSSSKKKCTPSSSGPWLRLYQSANTSWLRSNLCYERESEKISI